MYTCYTNIVSNMSLTAQTRAWCFTLNNPTVEEVIQCKVSTLIFRFWSFKSGLGKNLSMQSMVMRLVTLRRRRIYKGTSELKDL